MVKQKGLSVVLAIIILLALIPFHAFASAPKEILISRHKETYQDGSYAVVSVYRSENVTRDGTVSGHKDYNYYDGGLAWTFTVYGTFAATGTSASCISASYGISIQNNAWYCLSGSARPSGNAAVASGTMCRGTDGRRVYPSVTLYCSPNGSLS